MPQIISKPWYKKWWAITLFIIVGLGLLGNLLEGQDTSAPSAPQTTPPQANPAPEQPAKAATGIPSEEILNVHVNAPDTIMLGEDYDFTVSLENKVNAASPKLDVFVSSELFKERREITLAPLQKKGELFGFSLPESASPGDYMLNVKVYYGTQIISRQEFPFTVSEGE